MEDSRGNSRWPWVLGVIALMVAVVGLVLAIAANNSAVDEDQVVHDTATQLKGELSGLGGALKAGKEAQRRANQLAARDRARIKRAVAAATGGARKKIGKLNSEVAELKTEIGVSQKNDAELKTDVSHLTTSQTELEAEFRALKKRLKNLSGNGGT
jgi:chromosome segregation ATPase